MNELVEPLPGTLLSTIGVSPEREIHEISVAMLPLQHAEHLENFADKFGAGWLDLKNKQLRLQFQLVALFGNAKTDGLWLSVTGEDKKIILHQTSVGSPDVGERHPELPWAAQSRFVVDEIVELPDWAISHAMFELWGEVAGKHENIGFINVGEVFKNDHKHNSSLEEPSSLPITPEAVLPMEEIIISSLYRHIFGREAEPHGLHQHTNYLKQKGVFAGLPDLIHSFLMSNEGRLNLGTEYYGNLTLAIEANVKFINYPTIQNVISLGTNCFTSKFLTSFGLKRYSCPFDWLFSSPRMITHCIEDDFKTLLNNQYYEPVPVDKRKAGSDFNQLQHRYYLDNFNVHHVFNYDVLLESDYSYLVHCVQRLRNCLASKEGKLFLMCCKETPTMEQDFLDLSKAIRQATENAVLFVFVVANRTTDAMPVITETLVDGQNILFKLQPVSEWLPLSFADVIDEIAIFKTISQLKIQLSSHASSTETNLEAESAAVPEPVPESAPAQELVTAPARPPALYLLWYTIRRRALAPTTAQPVGKLIPLLAHQVVGRIKGMNRLFLLTTVLPTLISGIYFGFIASDVYISESHFVVRSPERQTNTGLGALLQGTGFSRSQDDTYTVHDFVLSRDALKQLDQQFAVGKAFANSNVDIFSRFSGLSWDNSFEALYRYYQKRVELITDSSSSISTLTVSAFTPEDAYQINEKLLEMSENLVNQLNDRGRQDMIRFAEAEVATAEQKAKAAALAVSSYRNLKGVFDPEKQSALQLQQVSKLQDELIASKMQLDQVQTQTRDNPQIPYLKKQLKTLQTEIDSETAKVAGGDRSLANKSTEYDGLILERGFAEKQLAAAFTSLEQARNDAMRKQLYLERIAQPSKPDWPEEPRRLRNVVATLLLGLIIWGVLTLTISAVKEHND